MKYLDLDSLIHPLIFELDFLNNYILNGLELYYTGSKEFLSNYDFITYYNYLSSEIFYAYKNYSSYPSTLYFQKFYADKKKQMINQNIQEFKRLMD